MYPIPWWLDLTRLDFSFRSEMRWNLCYVIEQTLHCALLLYITSYERLEHIITQCVHALHFCSYCWALTAPCLLLWLFEWMEGLDCDTYAMLSLFSSLSEFGTKARCDFLFCFLHSQYGMKWDESPRRKCDGWWLVLLFSHSHLSRYPGILQVLIKIRLKNRQNLIICLSTHVMAWHGMAWCKCGTWVSGVVK